MATMKPADMFLFRYPPRKTSDINFAQKIKSHGFAERIHSGICNQCSSSRDQLVRQLVVADRADDMDPLRNHLTDYLTKFSGFLYHPDNPGGDPSKLKPLIFFWWNNMITKPTNYAANSSFYDAANMLIASALYLLNWSGRYIHRSTISTAEKIEKECYATACEAAGMIEKAQELMCKGYEENMHTPVEQRAGWLEGLHSMSLATAQELGCLRALHNEEDKASKLQKDQLKPDLMCKLLHQCAQLYQDAQNNFHKVDSGDDGIGTMMKFCQVKSQAYTAISYIALAFAKNKVNENGEAIMCCKQAKIVALTAVRSAKEMKKKDNELIRWANGVVAEADAKVIKFERENTMVFHQKLPDQVADLPSPQVLARGKEFELPKPSEDMWTDEVYTQFVIKEKALDAHAKKEGEGLLEDKDKDKDPKDKEKEKDKKKK